MEKGGAWKEERKAIFFLQVSRFEFVSRWDPFGGAGLSLPPSFLVFFSYGCFAPSRGQFTPYFCCVGPFPPPLCQVWPLFPHPPPFLVQLFRPVVKLGPLLPLVARARPNVMSCVLDVVPFFHDVICLVINGIIKLFMLFLLVVLLALWFPFLPLLPLLWLGC